MKKWILSPLAAAFFLIGCNRVEAYVQQMVGQGYDEATARQYAEQYYAAYYAQQGKGGGS